jgi:hypothetical protein
MKMKETLQVNSIKSYNIKHMKINYQIVINNTAIDYKNLTLRTASTQSSTITTTHSKDRSSTQKSSTKKPLTKRMKRDLSKDRRKYQQRLKNQLEKAQVPTSQELFIEVLTSILPNEISEEQLRKAVTETILFHNNAIMDHSIIEGTARYNLIRLYAIQRLESQNVESPDNVAVGKKDR